MKLSAAEFTGLNAYLVFDRVVFLQQQQRITALEDRLYKYSRLFMSQVRPNRADIAKFYDEPESQSGYAKHLR